MPDGVKGAQKPPEGAGEPSSFKVRIGSTTYTVVVHFSKTSTETMGDKIMRLIEWEVQDTDVSNKG
jgi:hypothetical protein